MPRRFTALVLVLATASCAKASSDEAPDAGVGVAPLEPARALVARLREKSQFPALSAVSHASEAALPVRANDEVRVTPKGNADAWVAVSTLNTHPIAFDDVDSVRVHVGVAPGTDLVRAAIATGFEEVRVLRDATAAPTFRQRVRTGPAIATLRVREGHVEAVDAAGYVHVATAPMLAVDARGVERPLAVSLDGDTVVATLDTAGLAFPVAIDPLWSTVASVSSPRTNGTLVGIGNRRAIYAGGLAGGVTVGTTEVFDAATNTWTGRPAMATARSSAVGAFLSAPNKVLVCGGSGAGSVALATCERFDVAAGTWAAAASMSGTRPNGFSLVAYASGAKALLVDNTTQTYSYDGTGNAWTTIASQIPTAPLFGFASALLADGRVMIAGGGSLPPPGTTSVTNSAVSIFNPTSNGWSATNPMSATRMSARATVVGGKAYVMGGMRWCAIPSGFTGCSTKVTEVWDPATGAWSAGSDIAQGALGAYTLGNGRGYVFEQNKIWELVTAGSSTLTTAGTDASSNLRSVQISPTEVLFFGNDGTGNDLFSLSSSGSACVFGFECGTGNCTGGACCEAASCPAGFVCNGPTKPGKCVKLIGNTCSANADCDSGFCVDGVCCNAACGGQCQACDVPGKAGTCTTVFGPPHGARTACAGTGSSDPCVRMACNGTDAAACHHPGAGVPCGAASCTAGVETHVGACDGAGKCSDVPKSCGSYSCGATACKSSCSSPPECAAGYYCDMTKAACLPFTGLGNKCDSSTPCTAGLSCVDGVCCGKSSCGAGGSCAVPGKEGTCYKLQGFSCTNDLDCGSGHCVDGTCCDSACKGQCEACDVKGAEGTCTPVTGKPHGVRAVCASEPGNVCASQVCDGATRDKCAGFVGSDVECREPSCATGASIARANCDGKGGCPTVITTSCDGYQCNPEGLACLGACTVDAECLEGFVCLGGRCSKKTAICSGDDSEVVEVDGSRKPCAPFRCKAGACLGECAATEDCQSGLACNAETKRCEAPTVQDDSGCALGRSQSNGGALLALFGLSLVGLVRRSRSS